MCGFVDPEKSRPPVENHTLGRGLFILKECHMKLLKKFKNACKDGKAYFESQKSMKDAWMNCKNADWMMWGLEQFDYSDDKNFRLFACKCVCDTPLPDGRYTYELLTDKRSRDAIEASIMFAYGKITEEDFDAAEAAAREVARAAWAAAGDARAVASDAAGDARDARAAAWNAASDAQADYLREFIKWEDVEKHIKKMK
jgi:hypothetical protein